MCLQTDGESHPLQFSQTFHLMPINNSFVVTNGRGTSCLVLFILWAYVCQALRTFDAWHTRVRLRAGLLDATPCLTPSLAAFLVFQYLTICLAVQRCSGCAMDKPAWKTWVTTHTHTHAPIRRSCGGLHCRRPWPGNPYKMPTLGTAAPPKAAVICIDVRPPAPWSRLCNRWSYLPVTEL